MTTQDTSLRALAEAAVHTYAAAMSAIDFDALAALFAPHATREDPIDTPVATGTNEIAAAFAGTLPTDGTTVDFAVGDIRGLVPQLRSPSPTRQPCPTAGWPSSTASTSLLSTSKVSL